MLILTPAQVGNVVVSSLRNSGVTRTLIEGLHGYSYINCPDWFLLKVNFFPKEISALVTSLLRNYSFISNSDGGKWGL